MMRKAVRQFAALFVAAVAAALPVNAAQDTAAGQKELEASVERLRQGDATVDLTRLRTLRTQLPGYEPYAKGDNSKEINAAMARGDFKEALRLARVDLDADYLDIDAHIVAMIAGDKSGDPKALEHHRWVVKGFFDSITGSGDGKAADTAYRVITVREEYAVLSVLGLRRKAQSLVHDGPHSFDVLTVVDPETNEESKIWFNIDPIIAHQKKLFEPKKAPAGGILGGVPAGDVAGSVHRVAEEVLVGRVVSRPQPAYPKMASAARVEGPVVVEVIVSETGTVESARCISGHPLLRDAAIAAAKNWVFEPTLLDGVPVKVAGTVTFNFRKS